MHEQPIPALLALLGVLLLVPGCGKDRPTDPLPEPDSKIPPVAEKTPKPDAAKPPVEPPNTNRPAYTVTAIGVTEEFAKNAAAAEKKYNNKLIEVEGTVSSASQNQVRQEGKVELMGFKEKPDDLIPRKVKCIVKKSLAGRVALLGKGQRVRIKGRFDTIDGGDVRLNVVEYEELTPSSVPLLTAEALAKAFTEDKSAAAKKYGDKEVIVEGIIVDLVAKDGQFSVKVAGNDNVRLSCTMLHEDEFKTLKKFAKVRIKGEVSLFDSREVIIDSAFLVNT
jgi:hypothetical protein